MAEMSSPTYTRCSEATSCLIGDGTAILDMRSSTYFTLNDVGTHIWDVLDRPVTADSIVDRIFADCDTADIPRLQIEQDVTIMLADLVNAELITVSTI